MAIPSVAAITIPMVPAIVRPSVRVKHMSGLNSFGGLKAHNHVASLGLPLSTHQCFAKIVNSFRPAGATCSAIDEIFRIASIMPALVLVGVAVGFVLLRVEAAFEEE